MIIRNNTSTNYSIIHTTSSIDDWVGGPARSITMLCSELTDAGLTTYLVANEKRQPTDSLILPRSSKVHVQLVENTHNSIFSKYSSYKQTIDRCIKSSFNYTVVHDHGIWNISNIASSAAAQKNNMPYLLSAHGALSPWALKYKAIKKKIAWTAYQKRIINSSKAIIATSDNELSDIKSLFPNIPVALIPNGIDLPEKIKGVNDGLGGVAQNLLFLSRLHPVKNIGNLIKAWASVKREERFKSCRLTIAGPDEVGYLAELVKLSKDLGVDESISFPGIIEDQRKSELYLNADVFILPSHTENFGIVAAEALSYGVPVIASKGTPWQHLESHDCGWWVDGDCESLAASIAEALLTPTARLHEMGLRGRNLVESRYGWQHIVNKYDSLYEWALTQEPCKLDFVY